MPNMMREGDFGGGMIAVVATLGGSAGTAGER